MDYFTAMTPRLRRAGNGDASKGMPLAKARRIDDDKLVQRTPSEDLEVGNSRLAVSYGLLHIAYRIIVPNY